jgi:hypothetical protein
MSDNMKLIKTDTSIDMEPENDTDQEILKIMTVSIVQAYQKGYADGMGED